MGFLSFLQLRQEHRAYKRLNCNSKLQISRNGDQTSTFALKQKEGKRPFVDGVVRSFSG